MTEIIEDNEYFFLPINLFENEKEVKDFCKISESIEDLQAFADTCKQTGGSSFVYIINKRIEELLIIRM